MKFSEALAIYGDVDITVETKVFVNDEMLGVNEVMKIMKVKQTAAYTIINKIKAHYKLPYKESLISKSKLFEYYGMRGNGEC